VYYDIDIVTIFTCIGQYCNVISEKNLNSLFTHIYNPKAYRKLNQGLEKLRFSLKSSKFVDSIKFSVYHNIDRGRNFAF